MGDEVNLQPDPFGLVEAATELVKLGFHVLPYCSDHGKTKERFLEFAQMP